MSSQFENFYTNFLNNVVPTQIHRVIIKCITETIIGDMHMVSGDARVKDSINQDGEHFIAVTDAVAYKNDGESIIYESPVFMLNKRNIIWILPQEEAGADKVLKFQDTFSSLVEKEKHPVSVDCISHLLHGDIHISSEENRVKDAINNPGEQFIAITDVEIVDKEDGELDYKSPVLIVNKGNIVWVSPAVSK